MPRVCWEEQLCVSCEFVTINSRCTDFLRSTGVIRAVSIDEIMNDVTPIRSDLSRFSRSTVVEGLEKAPDAINMLFTGGNTGKLIVKV